MFASCLVFLRVLIYLCEGGCGATIINLSSTHVQQGVLEVWAPKNWAWDHKKLLSRAVLRSQQVLRQVWQVPCRSLLLPMYPLLHGQLQVRLQLPLLTLHQATNRQARACQGSLQEVVLLKLLPPWKSMQVFPRSTWRAMHLSLFGEVQVFRWAMPFFPREEGGRQHSLFF